MADHPTPEASSETVQHTETKKFEAQEWTGEHMAHEHPVDVPRPDVPHEEVKKVDENVLVASSTQHDSALPAGAIVSTISNGQPVIQGLAATGSQEGSMHFTASDSHKKFQAEEWSGEHKEKPAQAAPAAIEQEAEGDVSISPLATPPPEKADEEKLVASSAQQSAAEPESPVQVKIAPPETAAATKQAPFKVEIPVKMEQPYKFEIPISQPGVEIAISHSPLPWSVEVPVKQPSPFRVAIPVRQASPFSIEIPVRQPSPFSVELPIAHQQSQEQPAAADAAAEKIRTFIPSCGLTPEAEKQLTDLVSEMQDYAHATEPGSVTQMEMTYSKKKTTSTTTKEYTTGGGSEPQASVQHAEPPQAQLSPVEPPTPEVATQMLKNLSSLFESVAKPGQQTHIQAQYSHHRSEQTTTHEGDHVSSIDTKSHGYVPIIDGIFNGVPVNGGVSTQVRQKMVEHGQVGTSVQPAVCPAKVDQPAVCPAKIEQPVVCPPHAAAPSFVPAAPQISPSASAPSQPPAGGLGVEMLEKLQSQLAHLGLAGENPINQLIQQSLQQTGGGSNVSVQYSSHRTHSTRTVTYEGQGDPTSAQTMFDETLKSLQNAGQQQTLQQQHAQQQQQQIQRQQQIQQQQLQQQQQQQQQIHQLQQQTHQIQQQTRQVQQQSHQVQQQSQQVQQQQQQTAEDEETMASPTNNTVIIEDEESNTSQQRESVEEGYVDDEGNVVISKKVTRIVTTTKTTYEGGDQKSSTETSRTVHGGSTTETGGPATGSMHEFPAAAQGEPLIRLKVNQNKFQGVMDEEKHIHLYPAAEYDRSPHLPKHPSGRVDQYQRSVNLDRYPPKIPPGLSTGHEEEISPVHEFPSLKQSVEELSVGSSPSDEGGRALGSPPLSSAERKSSEPTEIIEQKILTVREKIKQYEQMAHKPYDQQSAERRLSEEADSTRVQTSRDSVSSIETKHSLTETLSSEIELFSPVDEKKQAHKPVPMTRRRSKQSEEETRRESYEESMDTFVKSKFLPTEEETISSEVHIFHHLPGKIEGKEVVDETRKAQLESDIEAQMALDAAQKLEEMLRGDQELLYKTEQLEKVMSEVRRSFEIPVQELTLSATDDGLVPELGSQEFETIMQPTSLQEDFEEASIKTVVSLPIDNETIPITSLRKHCDNLLEGYEFETLDIVPCESLQSTTSPSGDYETSGFEYSKPSPLSVQSSEESQHDLHYDQQYQMEREEKKQPKPAEMLTEPFAVKTKHGEDTLSPDDEDFLPSVEQHVYVYTDIVETQFKTSVLRMERLSDISEKSPASSDEQEPPHSTLKDHKPEKSSSLDTGSSTRDDIEREAFTEESYRSMHHEALKDVKLLSDHELEFPPMFESVKLNSLAYDTSGLDTFDLVIPQSAYIPETTSVIVVEETRAETLLQRGHLPYDQVEILQFEDENIPVGVLRTTEEGLDEFPYFAPEVYHEHVKAETESFFIYEETTQKNELTFKCKEFLQFEENVPINVLEATKEGLDEFPYIAPEEYFKPESFDQGAKSGTTSSQPSLQSQNLNQGIPFGEKLRIDHIQPDKDGLEFPFSFPPQTSFDQEQLELEEDRSAFAASSSSLAHQAPRQISPHIDAKDSDSDDEADLKQHQLAYDVQYFQLEEDERADKFKLDDDIESEDINLQESGFENITPRLELTYNLKDAAQDIFENDEYLSSPPHSEISPSSDREAELRVQHDKSESHTDEFSRSESSIDQLSPHGLEQIGGDLQKSDEEGLLMEHHSEEFLEESRGDDFETETDISTVTPIKQQSSVESEKDYMKTAESFEEDDTDEGVARKKKLSKEFQAHELDYRMKEEMKLVSQNFAESMTVSLLFDVLEMIKYKQIEIVEEFEDLLKKSLTDEKFKKEDIQKPQIDIQLAPLQTDEDYSPDLNLELNEQNIGVSHVSIGITPASPRRSSTEMEEEFFASVATDSDKSLSDEKTIVEVIDRSEYIAPSDKEYEDNPDLHEAVADSSSHYWEITEQDIKLQMEELKNIPPETLLALEQPGDHSSEDDVASVLSDKRLSDYDLLANAESAGSDTTTTYHSIREKFSTDYDTAASAQETDYTSALSNMQSSSSQVFTTPPSSMSETSITEKSEQGESESETVTGSGHESDFDTRDITHGKYATLYETHSDHEDSTTVVGHSPEPISEESIHDSIKRPAIFHAQHLLHSPVQSDRLFTARAEEEELDYLPVHEEHPPGSEGGDELEEIPEVSESVKDMASPDDKPLSPYFDHGDELREYQLNVVGEEKEIVEEFSAEHEVPSINEEIVSHLTLLPAETALPSAVSRPQDSDAVSIKTTETYHHKVGSVVEKQHYETTRSILAKVEEQYKDAELATLPPHEEFVEGFTAQLDVPDMEQELLSHITSPMAETGLTSTMTDKSEDDSLSVRTFEFRDTQLDVQEESVKPESSVIMRQISAESVGSISIKSGDFATSKHFQSHDSLDEVSVKSDDVGKQGKRYSTGRKSTELSRKNSHEESPSFQERLTPELQLSWSPSKENLYLYTTSHELVKEILPEQSSIEIVSPTTETSSQRIEQQSHHEEHESYDSHMKHDDGKSRMHMDMLGEFNASYPSDLPEEEARLDMELETVLEEPEFENDDQVAHKYAHAHSKRTSHHGSSDNVSECSLQEFERLERELALRGGDSSLSNSEGELIIIQKRSTSANGSQGSLTEFEKLEKECVQTETRSDMKTSVEQKPTEDVMVLSDIHEESEPEEMSTRDDDEVDEDRVIELDESLQFLDHQATKLTLPLHPREHTPTGSDQETSPTTPCETFPLIKSFQEKMARISGHEDSVQKSSSDVALSSEYFNVDDAQKEIQKLSLTMPNLKRYEQTDVATGSFMPPGPIKEEIQSTIKSPFSDSLMTSSAPEESSVEILLTHPSDTFASLHEPISDKKLKELDTYDKDSLIASSVSGISDAEMVLSSQDVMTGSFSGPYDDGHEKDLLTDDSGQQKSYIFGAPAHFPEISTKQYPDKLLLDVTKQTAPGGEDESPHTYTTYESSQTSEDGSLEIITRTVSTRETDPIMQTVRFTGPNSQEKLNQYITRLRDEDEDYEEVESMDEYGNITKTVIRRIHQEKSSADPRHEHYATHEIFAHSEAHTDQSMSPECSSSEIHSASASVKPSSDPSHTQSPSGPKPDIDDTSFPSTAAKFI